MLKEDPTKTCHSYAGVHTRRVSTNGEPELQRVMGGDALLFQPLLPGQEGAEGGWGQLEGRHAGWKQTTGNAATALSFVPQEHNG